MKDNLDCTGHDLRTTNVLSGLKMCCLNINSLVKHFDELKVFIESEAPHIFGINETKLDDTVTDEELRIENYHDVIRKDRNRHGGGVAFSVHKSISFSKLEKVMIQDIEALPIKIKLPKCKPFVAITWYRPEGVVEVFKKFETLISRIDTTNLECILMGDSNCHFIRPNNGTRHLKDLFDTYSLTQIIDEPTRTTQDTKTLIDHIATNRPELASDSGVIPCGISDHDIVYMVRKTKLPKVKLQPKTLTTRNFKNFDLVQFRAEVDNIPFDTIRDVSSDVNELWQTWLDVFLAILNKHSPTVTLKIRGKTAPYMTSEIRKMIRQRDFLKAKANKTGSKYLWQAYQQLRNKVGCRLRKSKQEYFTRKIEDSRGNLKSTWKILRQVTGKGNSTTAIDRIKYENNEISDEQQISDICNHHFVSIGDKLSRNIVQTQLSAKETLRSFNALPSKPKFTFRLVTPVQVYDILKKLLNSKATGIHEIPNKILKACSDIISPHLSQIFNISLTTKCYPDSLKFAKVAPVYKGGDKDNLDNYRPISVLPTVARVFEKLIHEQMIKYFESNDLLSKKQWGFRSLHSTVLSLMSKTNDWFVNISKGYLNAVVFLDVKKAFDTIDHNILLDKFSLWHC